MRHSIFALCLAAASAMTAPATAQQSPSAPAPAVQPSAALSQRVAELPAIIDGTGNFDAFFAPAFKAQVPQAQFDQIGQQLKAQFGGVTTVEKLTARDAHSAVVQLGFERGIATLNIVVDPAAPHQVTGLLIAQAQPRNDTLAGIEAEVRALPGTTSFGIYALGNDIKPVHEFGESRVLPIGSAFKLWVLAEAARQVGDSKRNWTDVVTLGTPSLPSGIMQRWPAKSPATLHTLATLMISASDNTATDTLMNALGRANVDAMVARSGVADPAATLPVITTLEAFQLKVAANADLAGQWKTAGPEGRRKLLAQHRDRLTATRIDASQFAGKPVALDVEWFASPRDQAAVLDWLRRNGGDTSLQILAVNPGVPGADRFDYLGFKGGSEPGVVFGSWLVKTRQGNWYAVTGGWTRPDAPVDERTFALLASRMIAQLATR